MGTRSLTLICAGISAKPFVNMYRQHDGYPSGHGKELYEFLKPIKMVNGIGINDGSKVANGSCCLAAQMVAHFKDGPGGIYLNPPASRDCGQDYEYHVSADYSTGIRVKCFEVGDRNRRTMLFEGSVEAFGEFCNRSED